MKISEMLKIEKGVTSIIGGGGKTTLMLKLASELKSSGSVVICTTTKIYPPEDITLVTSSNLDEIKTAIKEHGVIVLSEGFDADKKLTPPGISFEELTGIADYIICEADGSKGLPLKAHNGNEPVIPVISSQKILVVGIDGVGRPINEVCHRPETYARFAGVKQEDIVTPEIAMAVVNQENLGNKILINKVESNEQMIAAEAMSRLTDTMVLAGSIRNGEYKCL